MKSKLASFAPELGAAYTKTVKQERYAAVGDIKKKALGSVAENPAELAVAGGIFKHMEADVVRGNILKTGKRIDGRDTKTVRPIEIDVGVLPRAHGSARMPRAGLCGPAGPVRRAASP